MDIRIRTDVNWGRAYPFWLTSVFPVQDKFLDRRLHAEIRQEHPFARYINCVRFLGSGVNGEKDDFYRGEGPEGEAVCDFTQGVEVLKGIIEFGCEPRIVLDNVPAAMGGLTGVNHYGHTLPPRNPKVWASYVRQLLGELIRHFGYDRVSGWRIRVGTEPDLYPGHWSASQAQYYRHYDNTVEAVTRILPDADIGPGNILDPMENPVRKYPHIRWGAELLDHCLGEPNLVNGGRGTRIRYFATSWYGHVGLNNDRFDQAITELRRRTNEHLKGPLLPLEVHEFAVLTDGEGRRLYNGDASEWGASWMADIADRVYRLQVAEVYQWATTTYGIPNPRTHVLQLLERMADGERLEAKIRQPDDEERIGCIAARKHGKYHLLVYRHRPEREESGERSISLRIEGDDIPGKDWEVVEAKRIDHRHSGYIRALYEDIEGRGIEPLEDAPYFGADMERRYGRDGRNVFNENKEKYRELAKLADLHLERDSIDKDDEGLTLHLDMASHSVIYMVLDLCGNG